MILTHIGSGRTRRLRVPRSLPALIMTAALLLAAAACGQFAPRGHALASTVAPGQGTAARPGSPAGGHRRLAALSASFTSAWRGWLLAAPPCASAVRMVDGAGGGTRRLAVPWLRVRARRGQSAQDRLHLGQRRPHLAPGRQPARQPGMELAAGLAGAGLSLRATAITGTRGFAFQEGVYQHQIWLTGDGGRHRTAVTVR